MSRPFHGFLLFADLFKAKAPITLDNDSFTVGRCFVISQWQWFLLVHFHIKNGSPFFSPSVLDKIHSFGFLNVASIHSRIIFFTSSAKFPPWFFPFYHCHPMERWCQIHSQFAQWKKSPAHPELPHVSYLSLQDTGGSWWLSHVSGARSRFFTFYGINISNGCHGSAFSVSHGKNRPPTDS